MNAHRCRRCGHWWAGQGQGTFITRFCPNCIPLIGHQLTRDNATIHEIAAGVA